MSPSGRPGRDGDRAVRLPGDGAAPSRPGDGAALSRPGDGDGWVTCAQGHRHWGRFGAAGLAAQRPGIGGPELLLQLRSQWSHHGGTWGLPGGARDSAETSLQAAVRECGEEVGLLPSSPTEVAAWLDDHGGWSYTTVVVRAPDGWHPHPANAESTRVAWVPVTEVATMALHPGFAHTWPRLQELLVG